mgnify:CR=1 FL=1
MKKLYEVLSKKQLKGDIGLEIECEGKGFKELKTAVWTSHDDGSLRGAYPDSRVEYVINGPVPLDTLSSALEELKVLTKGCVPNFSFRTSVHTHVNVLDLDENQIMNFIYAYLLIEEPLINYCGNSRKCNRFCLRLQDADFMLHYMKRLFSKGLDEVYEFDGEDMRYAAINLAAMNKYGSIEFRSMRGTFDFEVIKIWCTALVSLRNYACHKKTCIDVYEEFVEMGPEKFLQHVLGDIACHFMYKNLVKDCQRSFSLSMELPWTFKLSKEKEVVPKAPVKKVLRGARIDNIIFDELVMQAAGVNVHAAAIPNPIRMGDPV